MVASSIFYIQLLYITETKYLKLPSGCNSLKLGFMRQKDLTYSPKPQIKTQNRYHSSITLHNCVQRSSWVHAEAAVGTGQLSIYINHMVFEWW